MNIYWAPITARHFTNIQKFHFFKEPLHIHTLWKDAQETGNIGWLGVQEWAGRDFVYIIPFEFCVNYLYQLFKYIFQNQTEQ